MKTKQCPQCDGIMEATKNIEGENIWHCRCCYVETVRKVYNTKAKQNRIAKQNTFQKLIDELLAN